MKKIGDFQSGEVGKTGTSNAEALVRKSSTDSISQNSGRIKPQKPSEQERRAALLDRLADKSNIKKPKSETIASAPAMDGQKASKLAENVSNSKNFSTENTTRTYEAEAGRLPDNFDVDRYVTDQVKAQKARSKVPLKERIADTTAELKHYLVDDAVAYDFLTRFSNMEIVENIRHHVQLYDFLTRFSNTHFYHRYLIYVQLYDFLTRFSNCPRLVFLIDFVQLYDFLTRFSNSK